MVLFEGALVIAAVLIAGALAGYLYHEARMNRRMQVFVDRETVRGFLERKYGIVMSQDDWDFMTRAQDQGRSDKGKMLGRGQ